MGLLIFRVTLWGRYELPDLASLNKKQAENLSQGSAAFKCLLVIFPNLSEAKIKGGIYVGPPIKKVFESTV